MKKTVLLTLAILAGVTSFGQKYSDIIEPQSIISERLISLNGGLRASAGGKSRTVIPINLPAGTVAWYYSFSTSTSGSGTKNLQLLLQLTAFSAAPTKLASMDMSDIQLPPGSQTIDVYLLDKNNIEPFINKVDNQGGSFNYYPEGTVTATRQGTVGITHPKSPVYLGIKNPSALDGIDVTLEVVAMVSRQTYDDVWSIENKEVIYNNCTKLFVITNAESEQICDCVKMKLAGTVSPTQYNELSDVGKNKLYKENIKSCATETGHSNTTEQDHKIRELSELLKGQQITKDYEAQEQTLKELIANGLNTWEVYNGLGFAQLCLKKYEEAKKSLQIGLGKKPEELLLLGNLGDYYLLSGKYNEAMEIFSTHKYDRFDGNRRFKDIVAEDLREFERLGISNDSFIRVRSELGIH